MEDNSIVGTWRLISWEMHDADGEVTYPLGRDAVGHINYTPDGFVFVMIAARMRSQATAPGESGEGAFTMGRRTIAYSGTYERNGDELVHHVQISSFPNWTGTHQKRFISWQDGRIVLRTPTDRVNGKEQTAYLVWERLPGGSTSYLAGARRETPEPPDQEA